MPFIHDFMDRVDLTDRDSKVFAQTRTVQIETKNESEENFNKIVETVCFTHYKEIGKPVFVYATSSKGHHIIYFRKGINQISDGNRIVMFEDMIPCLVPGISVKTDNMRKVVDVGYETDGKFCPIKCYEYE